MRELWKEYVSQRDYRASGGLYHHTQVTFAYNSNHMEGSRLSPEQTREIFETQSVSGIARVDDVVETSNHFKLFDAMLDRVGEPIDAELVKEYHRLLKYGTAGDKEGGIYQAGMFKSQPNYLGDMEMMAPSQVEDAVHDLCAWWDAAPKTFHNLVDFHYRFESIHPFQDGNGRVGRVVMFQQCLEHDIVPVIVHDEFKGYYIGGLQQYGSDKTWLQDTCRFFQDMYVKQLLPLVPQIPLESFRDNSPKWHVVEDIASQGIDVDRIVESLARSGAVERIYLFGSRVKGSHKEDSDIDIYVTVAPTQDDWITLGAQARGALSWLPVSKDVLVEPTEVFEERAAMRGSVENTATTEGILIYERHRGADRHCSGIPRDALAVTHYA